MAADSFAMGVNWLLERTVGTGMNGVSFGPYSFSDLGFTELSLSLIPGQGGGASHDPDRLQERPHASSIS